MNPWLVRLRLAAVIAAIALVVVGIVGVLAIPAAVRWGVETVATRELGRAVTVEQVRANPYTLRVTLRGLAVAGAAGETAPLLTAREITANASLTSLFRLAPVLDALKIDGVVASIVRLDANTFNFSDIVERIRAKPRADEADQEPARFALNNIEISDSTVNFDDRPTARKHLVDQIRVGIPFLSSLPSHAEITVQPALHLRLNGTPVDVEGETRPFADTLESLIHVKLDELDIPTYLAYVPMRLNFAIPRGKLDTDLQIAFRRAAPASADRPAQPAQTLISGTLGVDDFALAAPAVNAQPLLEWKSLRIALQELQPFDNRLTVADAALDGPVVHAVRDASGSLNWQRFGAQPLQMPAAATPATAQPASARQPFAFTLQQARITGGTLHVADDSAGEFRIRFVNLAAQASAVTNTSPARGKLQLSLDIADNGGSVTADGEVGLAPVGGRLQVASRAVQLRSVARYLANVVNATIDGSSDTDATIVFETAPQPVLALQDIRWRGTKLSARGPAGSGANLELAAIDADDVDIDVLQRQATFASIRLDGPSATVRRLPNGELNWAAAFRPPARGNSAPEPDNDQKAQPWTVLVKEAAIARGAVQIEDQAVQPAVKVSASAINGTVRNLHADGSQRAEVALAARLGRGGSLSVQGGVRPKPLDAALRIGVANLDAAILRPYMAERLNALLAQAEVSARGQLRASQAGDAPLQMGYRGTARLGNLHVLDPAGENDLLKWQVLDLSGIDVQVGRDVPQFAVEKATLSDFYARVIVSEQGRLNLADLVRRPGEPAVDLSAAPATTGPAEPKKAPAPPAAQQPPPVAAEAVTASGTTAAEARPLIRIGHIEFVRGNVNFSDNFIKPNYTANMTDLGGNVTTLASDSTEPATLTLAGKIDDDAPVDINGRLQPLAPVLFLDIEGRTRGIDLPRLTPYSLKYAGYPILKGKLTMEVKYKIEDRKLAANNHVYIDQLTLGDRVDSPTATKLPVTLAVSLLKNSRGEIDINLPVSGSLDDPKFSIGGLIVQVIVNLLTKVVTAPFSLLAAAFGGGEELGYIDFAAGSAALGAEQTKRIDTLSKALNDRPALKLDVIGRADPAVDSDGVLRDKLDAKLRAAKVRQSVRRGGESLDPAKVTIAAEERPALLAAVYDEEKIPDKPRNFIGIAKSIPAPEMEKLIIAHLAITPDDLRELANQRAAAVRDRLEEEGKVSRERVFLVEPKVGAGDAKAGPNAGTRVDFALK